MQRMFRLLYKIVSTFARTLPGSGANISMQDLIAGPSS